MPIELISEIVPKNNGDFALVDDNNLRGGFQTVFTIADMEAIPADKRKEGMQVFCQDTQLTYVLKSDKTTWQNNTPPPTSYVHNQITSQFIWAIHHGLKKNPSIITQDSLGRNVAGEIAYDDEDNAHVTFLAQFSGKAFCN